VPNNFSVGVCIATEKLADYCVPCFWKFNKSYSMCWFPTYNSFTKLCDYISWFLPGIL